MAILSLYPIIFHHYKPQLICQISRHDAHPVLAGRDPGVPPSRVTGHQGDRCLGSGDETCGGHGFMYG